MLERRSVLSTSELLVHQKAAKVHIFFEDSQDRRGSKLHLSWENPSFQSFPWLIAYIKGYLYVFKINVDNTCILQRSLEHSAQFHTYYLIFKSQISVNVRMTALHLITAISIPTTATTMQTAQTPKDHFTARVITATQETVLFVQVDNWFADLLR